METALYIIKKAFARAWRLVSPGFILCLLAVSPFISAKAEEIKLSPNSMPVLRKIDAGESHLYSIELKANEYIRFKFEKGDLRFDFDVSDSAGNGLFSASYQRYGSVEPYFIAARAGVYRLKITSLEKDLSGYNYRLEIAERRRERRADLISLQAEEKFQQAERLRKKWAAQHLESALKVYDEAAAIWMRQKQWSRLASAFEQKAEIYLIFGNYRKSAETYRQTLIFSRRAGDKTAELQQYCNIAKINSLTGNFRRAKQYLSKVKKTAETINLKTDNPLLADLFNNLGEISHAEGNLNEARDFFEKALKIWQNLKHRQGEAVSYQNLGYTNIDSGEVVRAEKDFEQALALWQELHNLRGEALTLTAQGHLRSFFLQWESALNAHADVQKIFEYIGDRQGEAVAFNGMGYVYEILNRPDSAIHSYRRALEINKELRNQSFLAVTSFALARAYRLQKNFVEAQKYYQESLELCRKTNKPRIEAYILNDLAGINMATGEEADALNRYRQTISFYQKIGDIRGEALILVEIGNVYQKQNNLISAAENYRLALDLNRKIGDSLGISGVLYHLAEIEFKRENLTEAKSLLEESISLTEQMRIKLRNPTLRAAYRATSQNKIELLIDILMRLHQNNPQPELIAEMLEKVEQSRARTLLELLNETRIEPRFEVSPELLKQEKELQKKLAVQIEKEMSLRFFSGSPEELEKTLQEISSLNAKYEQLQSQIKTQDPRYEKMVEPPVARLADIQSALQKEKNTVYLSYFLGARKSYVWLVEKTGIKVFELEDRNALEASAREVYHILTAPQRQADEPAAQWYERTEAADKAFCQKSEKLSRQLLGQVAPYINGERLLVSLDGALQYVPLEALPAPAAAPGGSCNQSEQPYKYTPVLETNEVVYVPSFSILNNLRRNAPPEIAPLSNDKLAIWADPVYESDDPRVANKNLQLPPDNDSEYLLRESLPVTPLHRLLNTRLEANQIADLWSADKVDVFTGFEVNRRNLTTANLADYRFIHIAAHGLFNNSHPENSGLLVSQFNEYGQKDNGFVSLQDIFHMHLKADLVVLSTCQSGLGEDFSGEGLSGLKHGFFYAGAKSAIVSLWQVDDESTASLMRNFYQELLENELSAPAALREAKRKIYRQSGWEHPYYWAAFTLHGDYSISRPAKQNFLSDRPYSTFFIIFFSLLVIFFGFYHLKKRGNLF